MAKNKSEYEPMEDEDLLFEILLPLVDYPEDLRIKKEEGRNGGTKLVVSCNDADRGRVIGSKGSTAIAVRQIFRSIGSKEDRMIDVDVYDPTRAQRRRRRPDSNQTYA